MQLDVKTLIPQITIEPSTEQFTEQFPGSSKDLTVDSLNEVTSDSMPKTKLDPSSLEKRSLAEIRSHLLASAEVKQKTVDQCSQALLKAAQVVSESFRQGGKLLLCGNGGSAADCQHTAAEFVNRLSKDFERPGLPAISLTTDTSFMTAIANDYGFDALFARQVETLGKAGDVLLGISTSGKSPNVVQAMQAAKKKGMHTILLTGNSPNLEQVADIIIGVPSDHTQYIQETHLAIEHLLCSLVETELFA